MAIYTVQESKGYLEVTFREQGNCWVFLGNRGTLIFSLRRIFHPNAFAISPLLHDIFAVSLVSRSQLRVVLQTKKNTQGKKWQNNY